MDRERRTKRNQDRAHAALCAQTPPLDHTPASSSESSQSVQWFARSATPQPAPSPARYDSEESDHLSGHYTDRAAEHKPNYFPMPTCRMFERFQILRHRKCKNTPTIDFDVHNRESIYVVHNRESIYVVHNRESIYLVPNRVYICELE